MQVLLQNSETTIRTSKLLEQTGSAHCKQPLNKVRDAVSRSKSKQAYAIWLQR